MLRIVFAAVASAFSLLTRFAPGPRLIARIRQRDGLKWGVPAMPVAVPYYLAAGICQRFIEDGASIWLSVLMLWCLVMGTAFVVLGPVSLSLLGIARIRETADARRTP